MSSLHRAGLIALCLFGTSALVVACAQSDEEPQATPSDDDAGGGGDGGDRDAPEVVDGGPADAGSDSHAPRPRETCSSAGWCAIDVDPKLTFLDLWPLEDGSAVAIASRDDRSAVVVYEQSSWQVIYEVPFVLASVWASETDVWVSGGEPGYVAHGRREGTAWTWRVRSIGVPTPVTTVWGTGEGEIYALADTRVWRLAEDGDGDWAVDFGGDAPADETTFVTLTGAGKDDVWLTGSRGIFPACGLVAHKRGGTWAMVIEGTPDPEVPWPPTCLGIDGAAAVNGPATVAAATAPNELVTVVEDFENFYIARVRHLSDGTVDIARSNLSLEFSFPKDRQSLWGASADDLYMAQFGKVRRAQNLWADGGAWEISTVSLDGIALVKPFHVVRGTRSDDVWLAGESHVFHKTNH